MRRFAGSFVVLISILLVPGESLSGAVANEPGHALAYLQVTVTEQGGGRRLKPGDIVLAHYVGMLTDGTVFDSSRTREQPFAFTLSRPPSHGIKEIKRQVIEGWDQGFRRLRVGDKARFLIPASLAYGDNSLEKIPAGSELIFDVEVVAAKEHSLSDVVRDAFQKTGLAEARRVYGQFLSDPDYYSGESQFNQLGYSLLGDSQIEAAVQVFEWNVAMFPKSGNVYDSLGEGYLKQGDKRRALAAYQWAVLLDPENDNAVKAVSLLSQ